MSISDNGIVEIETDQDSVTEYLSAGYGGYMMPKNTTLKFEVLDKLTNQIILQTEGSIDYFLRNPTLYGKNTGHLSVHSLELEITWDK